MDYLKEIEKSCNFDRLIFVTYSGSKLYGTNSENSDTDIKFVYIPKIEDMILGKYPKHYTFSTGEKHNKNNSEDIDFSGYSVQYYLEMLSKGETNALDLYFAHTNKDAVIYYTEEWNELVNNRDKLLTKNMKAYLGYCKNQSVKYSLKGDKLKNYSNFMSFCWQHYYDSLGNGQSKTLRIVLDEFLGHDSLDNYIPRVGEDRIKANFILSGMFGEHCYFVTSDNKESYISISDVKFGLDESISDVYRKVNKVVVSYGKRAENAASDNGADYKAISHAIRVSLQVEEILFNGYINFPLKDRNFIKSIKYKNTHMSYDEIMDWLNKKIEYIEKELLPNSKLREKSDFDWIENYILKCYNGETINVC